MSERSEYSPGEFSWVDLSVPDPEAAAAFYSELLGWDWEQGGEEVGGYGMFTKDGKVVAGMGPLQDRSQPPVWMSYVTVADADETAERAKRAGGSVVIEPFDVLDAGRMAVLQDPQGAFLSAWQPKRTTGAQLVNEPGSWTWNQLFTDDLDGAKAFYGDVFGWSLERSEEAPPDSPYMMWRVDGQRWPEGVAGAMEMGDDFPAGVPPHWMVYLAVEDAGKAVEATERAGGQVILPPMEIPVGKLAGLLDPQDAAFSIIEPDYPEPR